MEVLAQAKRPSTHKQYNTYLSAWFDYCSKLGLHPHFSSMPQATQVIMPSIRQDLRFLPCFSRYSVPFGQQPMVKPYMRGVYNFAPPRPYYIDNWDPNVVLGLLRRWGPPADITFKSLTLTLPLLILLVSGQHIQTSASLDIAHMTRSTTQFTFRFYSLFKQPSGLYKPLNCLKNLSS